MATNKGFIDVPTISGPWSSWGVSSSLNVYSVSWDFNDSSSASTLKVNLISDDGIYSYDILSKTLKSIMYSQKCQIKMGNFTFNGYFTDFDIEKTPEQKLLSLEFVDIGADLDRWYVGLHQRHGQNGVDQSARLIICGKEYSPCDANLDSNIPYNATNGIAVDPCDPCPSMPANKYKSSCNGVNAYFNVWETWYTFNELISKLQQNVFTNISNGQIDISGITVNNTFRSQHVGKLKDVLSAWCSDLGLAYYWDTINSKLVFINRQKLINIPSYSELAGNSNVIDLKYGETAKSTFSRGFLGFFSKEGEIHSYTCSIDPSNSFYTLSPAISYNASFLTACGLAYYSKQLFSAWSWLNNGGREIGISKLSTISKGDIYEQLNSSVLSEEQISAMGGRGSYYYIIANCDENVAQKNYEYYQYIANNILGKYWATRASFPVAVGNYFDEGKSVEVEAMGGSGKFYSNYNDLLNWPIDVSQFDAAFTTRGAGVIGIERQAVWYPDQNSAQSSASVFSYWGQFVPRPVGSDGRPPQLFSIYPSANSNSNIKLFVVQNAPRSLNISYNNTSNPGESSAVLKTQTITDVLGVSHQLPLKLYGLTLNACLSITVEGFTFYTPVGAAGNGGQTVFVTASDSFKIALPKIQKTVKYSAGNNPNVAQIDYHYHEARENNVDLFNTGKTCLPTDDNINSYFNNISQNSYFSQPSAQKRASFKVPGICPLSYGIGQGLNTVQISLTSNGFYTTYNLQDKIVLPPSDEYLTQSIIARTIPRTSVARQYINSTESQIVSPIG
jgi:hypothetical protein